MEKVVSSRGLRYVCIAEFVACVKRKVSVDKRKGHSMRAREQLYFTVDSEDGTLLRFLWWPRLTACRASISIDSYQSLRTKRQKTPSVASFLIERLSSFYEIRSTSGRVFV